MSWRPPCCAFPVSLTIAVIALLAGCPASSGGAPQGCQKLGETCTLDKGLLGICTEGTRDCDGAPCLVCMGQH